MNDQNLNAYCLWVVIIIHNAGNGNVKLENLDISWGKLHADGDKNKEISKDVYEGHIIGPGEKLQLNGCGRENVPAGTTGEFDLCDADDSDKRIRHFCWDCPAFGQTNTWTVSGSNPQWTVKHEGANLEHGALGTITVEVTK